MKNKNKNIGKKLLMNKNKNVKIIKKNIEKIRPMNKNKK